MVDIRILWGPVERISHHELHLTLHRASDVVQMRMSHPRRLTLPPTQTLDWQAGRQTVGGDERQFRGSYLKHLVTTLPTLPLFSYGWWWT